MPSVKVVGGDQFHVFMPGTKRSSNVLPGHADAILEFRELVQEEGTGKWIAAFVVLEAAKESSLRVFEDVLISDAKNFYALSFKIVRSEIRVTFYWPGFSRSRDTKVYFGKEGVASKREVRFSTNPHPAQKKRR